jgi:hypothetical protein
VTFTHENKEEMFPCYFPTGEIFNQDSENFIRFKCVLLVGATPVMTVLALAIGLPIIIVLCIKRELQNSKRWSFESFPYKKSLKSHFFDFCNYFLRSFVV